MSDLGRILGSILASIAHARRIADEETLAIAEYYRSNPLMEGLSLPRVRLPELNLELPVLVKAYKAGEADVIETDEKFRDAVILKFKEFAEKEAIRTSAGFFDTFETTLIENIKIMKSSSEMDRFPREVAIRAVEKAMVAATEKAPIKMTADQEKRLKEQLRTTAGQAILIKRGNPDRLDISVITSEVKESAGSGNIARMKVAVKEEGLEWSIGESNDGSISGKLIPE